MNIESIQAFINAHPGLFLALIIWTLVWKGLALWKAGQRGDKGWFIAILIVNTFGILDIIYYYFVSKRSDHIDSETDTEKQHDSENF